jgi:hypothetical protein
MTWQVAGWVLQRCFSIITSRNTSRGPDFSAYAIARSLIVIGTIRAARISGGSQHNQSLASIELRSTQRDTASTQIRFQD